MPIPAGSTTADDDDAVDRATKLKNVKERKANIGEASVPIRMSYEAEAETGT